MSCYYRDKSADTYSSSLVSNNIINNFKAKPNDIAKNSDNINSKDKSENSINKKSVNVSKSTLIAAIDNLNLNKSVSAKNEGREIFKKKIDKLNLKFYIETEKYLNNQNDMDRCQDQLFIILFKQISLYSEEVERLNNIINDYKSELVNKIGDSNDISKFDNLTSINNSLRSLNKELEKRLQEKNKEEDKYKQEIGYLKRQVKSYKEKYNIDSQNSNIFNMNYNNSINVYNSVCVPFEKKYTSSDKIINLTDEKNTINKDINNKNIITNMVKTTLSMNNFNKHGLSNKYNLENNNSKNLSSSLKSNHPITISNTYSKIKENYIVEINSDAKNIISKETNKYLNVERENNVNNNNTFPNKIIKKRNYSDNDPHLSSIKIGKDNNLKHSERIDLMGSNKLINQNENNTLIKQGKDNLAISKKPSSTAKIEIKNSSKKSKLKLLSNNDIPLNAISIKSPNNVSKKKIELTSVANAQNIQSKSPPKNDFKKSNAKLPNIIDEEFANDVVRFIDFELKELIEIELKLNKLKNLECIKMPFTNSNTSNYNNNNNNVSTNSNSINSNIGANVNNKKLLSNNKASQNILIKKKYQLLNSVTIDLIDSNLCSNGSLNVSSTSLDRSKSKKNK